MHQGFARIAAEARGERRVDAVLRTLSSTTQQCVACHAQFQLRWYDGQKDAADALAALVLDGTKRDGPACLHAFIRVYA